MTLTAAAGAVIEEAYVKASGNGRLPPTARQVFYPARDLMYKYGLVPAGRFISDKAFTQKWLPDYQNKHPHKTRDWKVNYDARGTLIEPHTRQRVPLGTAEVERYLHQQPKMARVVTMVSSLYPAVGPENRFRFGLYIEKEGFGPLLEAAQIAERYDICIMSNKGMSVTATRRLIDVFAVRGVEKILVAHDFDAPGFSNATT
jgi:hypothetical protein